MPTCMKQGGAQFHTVAYAVAYAATVLKDNCTTSRMKNYNRCHCA